jgi:ribonuclease HI
MFLMLEHIQANHPPGCETWVHNWVRNGWKTAKGGDVLNKSLIRYLVALLDERAAMGLKVSELEQEADYPIHARALLSAPAGSRQRPPRHLWQRASGPSGRRGHAQAG